MLLYSRGRGLQRGEPAAAHVSGADDVPEPGGRGGLGSGAGGDGRSSSGWDVDLPLRVRLPPPHHTHCARSRAWLHGRGAFGESLGLVGFLFDESARRPTDGDACICLKVQAPILVRPAAVTCEGPAHVLRRVCVLMCDERATT